MTIKVERIEILGINVHDVARARELFSRLFGLTFLGTVFGAESHPTQLPLESGVVREDTQPLTGPTRVDIDTAGLFELVESHRDASEDSVRNIHLKVTDIETALVDMQREGIGILANLRIGKLREVVLDPRDLCGARLCLVEYPGASLIDAMLDA